MRSEDVNLLSEQLRSALADVEGQQGEAFEVAVLAGLLCRHEHMPGVLPAEATELVAQARRIREMGRLAAAMPDEDQIEAQIGRIYDLDGEESEEEQEDALFDLDEACAGAWFCGQGDALSDPVDRAARAIDALPGPWRPLAALATTILEQAPPLPGDPALLLWRTVEATRWHEDEAVAAPAELPLCLAARDRLGLPPRFSAGGLHRPLQASSTLELEVRPLVSGEGFDLALSTDESGRPALVLRCESAPVQIERDGAHVILSQVQRGLWTAGASPGIYRVLASGKEYLFELDER